MGTQCVFYHNRWYTLHFNHWYGMQLYLVSVETTDNDEIYIGKGVSDAEARDTIINQLNNDLESAKKGDLIWDTDEQFWIDYYSGEDNARDYFDLYEYEFVNQFTNEAEEWFVSEWRQFWKNHAETAVPDWFKEHKEELSKLRTTTN